MPTLDEAVRVLAEETAWRIRRGESRAAVRADLVAAGLSAEFVDGLLVGITTPTRWPTVSVAVVALSAPVLLALPIAGAGGGVWLAWQPLTGEACGMSVFPALVLAACAGVVGLAAGVSLSLVGFWCLSASFGGAGSDA